MKNKLFYIIGLFLIVSLVGCDMRTYDVPEIAAPTYDNPKGLEYITIQALKDMYPSGTSYDTYNLVEGTNKAVKAYISGNDESGNLYKTLYIQDETGAIIIGTQLTGQFPKFRIGQEVIVELDGLAVGRYAGSFQIGGSKPSIYVNRGVETKQMDRMSPAEFLSHVHRNGSPDPSKVTIKTYTSLPDLKDENIRGTLAILKDVEFVKGGKTTFFDFDRPNQNGDDGNMMLKIGGKEVIVRTSEYSNFASDTLPTGKGDLTCLLTKYERGARTPDQLVIRSRADVLFTNATQE